MGPRLSRATSSPRPLAMITPAKHLDYAAGYLQLRLYAEARAELAQLPVEELATPAALDLRQEIAMAEENWAEVVAISPDLVGHNTAEERPWIAWAYALRELQRIEEARDTLLTGARLINRPSPVVAYNLACYACLLGHLPEARRLLDEVFAQDESWRAVARDDTDLAALHPEAPR
jgi:tetratricopeptide (TPR) repeat protein